MCSASPGRHRPPPDKHTQHLCRQQTRYGPSYPAIPFATLYRIAYTMVAASIVPIIAAAIPDIFASGPAATSTSVFSWCKSLRERHEDIAVVAGSSTQLASAAFLASINA